MSGGANPAPNPAPNPARGESALHVDGLALVVRPSFTALVAAEQEIGSLLALAERAAEGRILLREIEALLWHCLADRPEGLARERLGAALLVLGLTGAVPVLRMILRQILSGAP
ncbi:MAG: hypothetical protein ABS86_02515 [Sphingobium sp. SCN 64-10]|nr:MAG: hypothetical protein ABS86_02515 [Sphingobium sp. SCN 64-10]